jgi:E3 ubiquitin-protein ligase RNF14
MVCGKCNTFFCWLCEECLNPHTPYQHFSNPASKCYNLLFYGVPNLDVDDDDDDDDDDGWWNAAGIFLQNDDYDDDDNEAEDEGDE